MKLTRIVLAVRKWWTGRGPLDDLPGPAEVARTLARERARADRTGTCLSVVEFTPGGARGRPWLEWATLARLARLLPRRLRSTDLAGWLAEGRPCAVLPDTGAPGAEKVAREICDYFPGTLDCIVYVYPTAPLDEEREKAGEVAPSPAPYSLLPAPCSLDALLVRPLPAWKRCLDVAGAVLGLVVLAPLLAALALAVRLSSPGPALFRQRRSGRGGRPFVMYKFRTMVDDAEARKDGLLALNEQDGPAFKLRDDPRVTRLGRFLRKTSLDELPQLWNVLKGDMSLVGPRPLPCAESDACEGWQRQRLDVAPGLTCIWQVRGRCQASFADWMRMDIQYIRSCSLLGDLLLLLWTVPAVLLRRGAS